MNKLVRVELLGSSGLSLPCWSLLVSAGLVAVLPVSASAQCVNTSVNNVNNYVCTGKASTIVGAGVNEPSGSNVVVAQGAQLVVGPDSAGNNMGTGAISLGNNATITVNGLVQSEANGGTNTYNTGPNTVDINNNSTITVNTAGTIYASGYAGNAEAINPFGFGNVITNYGTIRADNAAAIWFQDDNNNSQGTNTVINEAGALIQGPSTTANAIGSSGNGALIFTNMGTVSGSLSFSGGNDQLNLYTGSTITGTINGGGGVNTIALDGVGSASLAGDSINNFQSLRKQGSGTWTISGALNNYDGSGQAVDAGPLAVEVQDGTLALTGTNTNFNGSMLVDANGILQGTAQNFMSTITDNGQVQFVEPLGNTYTGTISGTGEVVKMGAGILQLAPTATGGNSYSGGTVFDDGTVQVSSDSALGAPGGGLTFNGGALELTQAFLLDGSRQVTLNQPGGTIIVDSAALAGIEQGISGTGQLIKQGAGLLLIGDSSYSGGTDIQQGSLLGYARSFGAGNITDDGALFVYQDQDDTFSNAVAGSGSFFKYGNGVLTVTGAQTYSGTTEITAGALRSGAAQIFSPNSSYTVDSGSTLDLAGYNQTISGLANKGTVSLLGTHPGAVLTVSGDYIGTGGVLRNSVTLDAEGSDTDKLVVGGNVSGTTTMEVVNRDGLGALTTGNGIEEVQVGGTSTQTAFVLAGTHVDAGAYQYYLYQGDSNGKGYNWYLRSTVLSPSSGIPSPGTPSPGTPSPGTPSPGMPIPVRIAYRTVVPLYSGLVGELQQADLMMVSNFHRRVGETSTIGSGMSWMRMIGGKIDVKADGTTTPHSNGYLAGFQAGSDIYRGNGWRVGGYFGYLHGNMNVSGFAGGTYGAVGYNRMDNEYLGIYGTHTWQNGAYLDLVMQGGFERTNLHPEGAASNGVSSKSGLVSAEVGKPFALGASSWSIEPEAQAVRQWLSVSDSYISGDTTIHQRRTDGWLFRVGPRLVNNVDTRWGRLASYTRVNFNYVPNGTVLTNFSTPGSETTIRASGHYTTLELAAGGTLLVSRRTSLYGEVGHVWSVGGKTDVEQSVEGTMGIRVNW